MIGTTGSTRIAATVTIASAIAIRTGSLSLMQSVFPFVFVLLFTAPAFFPRELLAPALEQFAAYNPLTYVVEAVRGMLLDDGTVRACAGSLPDRSEVSASALTTGDVVSAERCALVPARSLLPRILLR